jgi:hypothetical protein
MDHMTDRTKLLLACGAIAGPVFTVVSLAQAVARPGFDLTKDQLSLLENGDLGWLQIANFVMTGLLYVAGAVGLSRALAGGPAGRWAPRLIVVFGLSLSAAAVFTADPAFGFPPGTPEGPPAAMSSHGGLHLLAASIGFLALIAACFVLARRFARTGRRGSAAVSIAAGALLFVATMLNGTLAGQAVANLSFTFSALLAFCWASIVMASVRGGSGTPNASDHA